MTTCFNFIRRTASATRCGSSFSSAQGLAVVTAQNPQARVHRSPAIIIVAVPWLQHSQRFGHCALSQTVWRRKSEISALVEKKTGFDGKRTLIQDGLCGWCRAGSIFAHDMVDQISERRLEKQTSETIADVVLFISSPPAISDRLPVDYYCSTSHSPLVNQGALIHPPVTFIPQFFEVTTR